MPNGITRMGFRPTYGEGSSIKKPCLSLGSSHPDVIELIDAISMTDHLEASIYSQAIGDAQLEMETYGPATDKLVREYQRLALGEEKDKVGPETWITLGYEGEACGASNGSTSNGAMSITQKKWFYPTVGLGVLITMGTIIWLMD